MSTSFPTVKKSQRGYDIAQVEEFLGQLRQAYESNAEVPSLTAKDIREAAFAMSKGGYQPDAVDTALDRLEEAFAKRERERIVTTQGQEAWYGKVREDAEAIMARLNRKKGKLFRRSGLLRQGYDRAEVDRFMERILAYFESRGQLTVSDVRGAGFRPKSNGYSEAQVDALIDAVIEVMLAVRK